MEKENLVIKEIIQAYLERGFGSMNKNDFEVWIFNEWRKLQDKDLSDYQVSKALKISETKVKRLKYEADLKYSFDEEQLLNKFFKLAEKANYKKDGDKLLFVINDKLLRQYINNILEESGRFMDSSFNSNIVSIYVDDFSFLLEKFNRIDKDKILERAKEKAESDHDFPVTIPDILKEMFINLAKEKLGGKLVDFTTNGIIDFVKHLKQENK